jgi:uncharacterized protein YutE (UPF0331/DUF86 family)
MVVVVVLLLRRPIIGALPNLRRIRYKDIEAEFGEILKQAEKEVAELPEPEKLPQDSREVERHLQKFEERFSNNTAIFIAWLSVESAILNLARMKSILKPNMSPYHAAQLLFDKDIISAATYRAIMELQSLRNIAIHPDEARIISDEETRRFKNLAEKVTASLESHLRFAP